MTRPDPFDSMTAAYAQAEAEIILGRGFTHWWEGHRARGILAWAGAYRCAICGQEMTRNETTIDHVWPRGAGGFNGLGNMAGAHRDCNEWKGARYPTGCEIIVLVSVCARLNVPLRLKDEHPWLLPELRRA